MPGLDTNVLVRWLMDDDPKQSARARRLFTAARAGQTMFFVPATAMLELEWVLRSRYDFNKATVLQAFNALLETQELEFQSEAALEQALHLYRQGTTEFADCLHAGLCSAFDRAPLLSFDAKASRLPEIQLVAA